MQFRRMLGLAALLALGCSVGCSMTNSTVRGQTPEPPGPIVGTAPGYGEFKRAPYLGTHGKHDFRPYSQFRDNNLGYEGGYYARPEPYITANNAPYTIDSGGCPDCNFGQSCPDGGCRRCGRGCGRHNYQTYQYNWPSNLVYPQQGVPSGMVQYPYYTLRGPTDFFMN